MNVRLGHFCENGIQRNYTPWRMQFCAALKMFSTRLNADERKVSGSTIVLTTTVGVNGFIHRFFMIFFAFMIIYRNRFTFFCQLERLPLMRSYQKFVVLYFFRIFVRFNIFASRPPCIPIRKHFYLSVRYLTFSILWYNRFKSLQFLPTVSIRDFCIFVFHRTLDGLLLFLGISCRHMESDFRW